ncbi:MAG: ABC transporter ATP-binding protein, partial [Halanaerobiaceae bacterium]|nr:ABC transporter ATP-binding protein [Halanaerobiaceae bacterium]
MINKKELARLSIKEILETYPFTESFFREQQFPMDQQELTIEERYRQLSIEEKEDLVIAAEDFLEQLKLFIRDMQEFLGLSKDEVESLTLLPGRDKNGKKENYAEIIIKKGEIVSIVGPTGSGKSRLLADIEWAADADTPTGRTVLINNEKGDKKWRLSGTRKLVAQLSPKYELCYGSH